jgi:hypothetical protein
MPYQVEGVLVHTMSDSELSRVRTELHRLNTRSHSATIQYKRIASLRPIATLAMLLCRLNILTPPNVPN